MTDGDSPNWQPWQRRAAATSVLCAVAWSVRWCIVVVAFDGATTLRSSRLRNHAFPILSGASARIPRPFVGNCLAAAFVVLDH